MKMYVYIIFNNNSNNNNNIWLVFFEPLWKIWKSAGIIIPNIWKK